LFFLDEIQACPEAFLVLLYFYEQLPELHVIAAGSLLEHSMNQKNYPMPVGRVEFCSMFPMDFEEFLMAMNETMLLEYLLKYKLSDPFSEAIHLKTLELFRQYIFIGGMPEAVLSFVTYNDPLDVERIQSSILTTFQYDFGKYGIRKEQEYLTATFNALPTNSGKKIKYSNIDSGIRSMYLKEALKKLERSRIVTLVKHTDSKGIPLSDNVKENVFKPLFLDIGLLNRMGGIKLIRIEDILTFREGMLAEQFIGQELLSATDYYADPQLYYWLRESKNSNAELDYLMQYNNQIIPIEVKAGKSGTLKSLQLYLSEKKLGKAVRFNSDMPSSGSFTHLVSIGNQKKELSYQLLSLPMYLCFRLRTLLDNIL
jgi:predicted AAA+ superfamily ATPase